MDIRSIGGEFALINRIAREPKHASVLCGIGDDCAVIKISDTLYHLYTVDMLVEGDHFSRDYFSPYDIGYKSMISNVSDIVSCGGKSIYALLSMSINDSVDVPFIDEFYRGIYDVCDRYAIDLIGGDTTHGKYITISINVIGEVTPENLRLRSSARAGDLIAVSAPIGGSTAGLRLFLAKKTGFDDVKRYHLHPECGADALPAILPISRAMTDVSDGLASEARNIALASGLSAHIDSKAIPLSKGIAESARSLGDNPLDYALYGGEDFALVYTLPPEYASRVTGTIVGRMDISDGVYLDDKKITRFGYDHFGTPS
jgi:thiamine-monophosphate kinase